MECDLLVTVGGTFYQREILVSTRSDPSSLGPVIPSVSPLLHTRDFPSSYAPASRESWRDLTQPIAGPTTGFLLHILGPDPPSPSNSDILVPTSPTGGPSRL